MEENIQNIKVFERQVNEKYAQLIKWKCNRLLALILIFLSFFTLLYFGMMFLFVPRISIIGNVEITLNLNDNYVEKGATATFMGRDISKKIKIAGKVNTSKIGKYEIVYSVTENRVKAKKARTVHVVDKVKPVITLIDGETYRICPNKKYTEPGYKAEDNYDGDITDKVKVDKKDSSVLYTVQDQSGNETEITRTIVEEDKEKPLITIKGNGTVYVTVGNNYVDSGATATDNCDGDLTNNILITNNVDISREGKYSVIYKVKDKSGNEMIIDRIVFVSKAVVTGPGKPGVIYLTFDDGPSATITPEVLKILKKYDIKATFFVINHSDKLDYLIKEAYDDGHTIALHSYTHNYATIYTSVNDFFNDLNLISDKVERITGKKSMLMRFAGGSSNTVSRKYSTGIMTTLTQEVINKGYHYFDWNVSSGDADNGQTQDGVYKMVTSGLSKKRSNVVLMHDFENNYKTLNSLEDIIKYAQKEGYTFEAIDMSTEMIRHKVNN